MSFISTKPEELFLKWYDLYNDRIFRYCFYKIYDREKALDLTQQTFVKVWEYLVKGNKIDSPQAFLYKTANNLIIDESRKNSPISLDELKENNKFEISSLTEQDKIIDAKISLEILSELSEEEKDLILMRYAEGMSPIEIAKIIGQNINSTTVKIFRAKNKFRKKLK